KKLWEREQEDWRLKKSNLLLTKNIGEGVARNSVRAQGKTFPSLKNRITYYLHKYLPDWKILRLIET
ncbi:MAG: hypothetical protein IJJ70_04960, partial [Treponema sp.]|nr:hypothetical protein [Treponema sp.]